MRIKLDFELTADERRILERRQADGGERRTLKGEFIRRWAVATLRRDLRRDHKVRGHETRDH